MRTRARGVGLPLRVLGIAVLLSVAVPAMAREVSLLDRGWRIADQAGKRTVVAAVLVVNDSYAPLQYEVRFILERSETPLQVGPASRRERGMPSGEPWRVVETVSVLGGPLEPGASAAVEARFAYELLTPGKSHRFRAELIDRSTDTLLTDVTVRRERRPLLTGTELAVLTALSQQLLAEEPVAGVSGTGTMVGRHEAHRAGGEWVEHGSGTINLRTSEGHLVLQYTYSAHGSSAATLVASATATGQLVRPGAPPLPVAITSASARMILPGARQQSGQVIRRSPARAAGTFEGVVGGSPCAGLLTMTNGIQTLNLATGRGQHRFDIQLTRAVSSATVSPGGTSAGSELRLSGGS